MGTLYLLVPKTRNGGYIPFFITERKRSEATLVEVVQEAFVQGVSTRKIEKLAKRLGIENLSRGQVSVMTKGLNEQIEAFHSRPLSDKHYPVLWIDALYEKVRFNGRVISMAILIVCAVNSEGKREVLSSEPMLEESKESYSQLFQGLKSRGLETPSLVVSDANAGLVKAIRQSFPGASWKRCKVHFMRDILTRVAHREKDAFAKQLKEIWLATSVILEGNELKSWRKPMQSAFPKPFKRWTMGLEDSLSFYAFPTLDARRVASTNMLEQLNREIRLRTRVVGIFPNPESYVRLVTTYLIEYAEDWSVSRAYLSEQSLQGLLNQAA